MIRFILGTFAMLGFAFYQLSGGSDFEPRRALVIAEVETETLAALPKPVVAKAPVPEVTRVAVDLTSVSPSAAKPAPVLVSAEKAEVLTAPPATVLPQATPPKPETTAIVPSLVRDVRRVSGNRVNIRSGPGKTFEVVTQLTRGVSVEIMRDNGDGWVEMRPMDGGQIGWVADFLLTDAQG